MKQSSEDQAKRQKQKIITLQEGFFPSFVYFPLELEAQKGILAWKCVKNVKNYLEKEEIQHSQLENLHLSLSKTVLVRFQEINKFIEGLRSQLKHVQLPFPIFFKKIRLINSFICLQVDAVIHQKLIKVLKVLDCFLKKHNMESYFENPIFHVSLFRIEGKVPNELEGLLQGQKCEKICFALNQIDIKIGNKIHKIKSK